MLSVLSNLKVATQLKIVVMFCPLATVSRLKLSCVPGDPMSKVLCCLALPLGGAARRVLPGVRQQLRSPCCAEQPAQASSHLQLRHWQKRTQHAELERDDLRRAGHCSCCWACGSGGARLEGSWLRHPVSCWVLSPWISNMIFMAK